MDDRSAGLEKDEVESPKVPVQAQNTAGDDIKNVIIELTIELDKKEKELKSKEQELISKEQELISKEQELKSKEQERKEQERKEQERAKRRLISHIQDLKEMIENAKDGTMPDSKWRNKIKVEVSQVGGKKSTVKLYHFPEYPEINRLDIKHARVLVLAITRFNTVLGTEDPVKGKDDRTYDDSYAAVGRSFIDHYGYEDVLERIMINMIVLERMKFKTRITEQDIKQVLKDLETWFQVNDFDVEHLEHFNTKYNCLYDKLATKTDFLNDVLQHFNSEGPSCFRNTYWTSDEITLMLDILIEDPKNQKNTNALIVLVCSHGNTNEKGETVILDCQRKYLEVNKIIKMFSKRSIQNNDEMCCLLFFHACRGNKKQEDHSVKVPVNQTKCLETNNEEDSPGSEISPENMHTEMGVCQGNVNTTGIDRCMTDTEAIPAKRSITPESTTSAGISESSIDTISEGIDNIHLANVNGAHHRDNNKENEGDFFSIKDSLKPHSLGSTEPSQSDSNLQAASLSYPNLPIATNSAKPLDPPVAGRHDVEAEPFSCDNFGSSGYCPANCLVAYSTTPGFTAASDTSMGCLYIEKLCMDMLGYERLPLLPFLTMMHGKLVREDCEMPMFEHSLYKTPILCRNKIEKDVQTVYSRI